MKQNIYTKLHAEGLLSDESFQKLKTRHEAPLFSVHWELNTILYLGVILLTGGLGTLIYKNIDTIGHQAVLAIIALICIGCFYYCFKHKKPFSKEKVASPNTGYDYILLLGSISLVTFIGYLQYQYGVFGNSYGLATFVPMALLFYIAYDFDHLGILSMAIVNLGIWMGVSVTPKTLLMMGTYNTPKLINTYLVLGAILLMAAYLSKQLKIKKHFKFSYQNYGTHIAFVALLSGFFHYFEHSLSLVYVAVVFALAGYMYRESFKERSFYFVMISILYGYIALCGLAVELVADAKLDDEGVLYFLLMAFIGSAIGLIILLININRKLKADDHI
ncbi:DUF2157 domain-containing protein [Mucilaginibacter conchicola]|uniref:DUF2157 domain-containing protein n=1 Tax=Mucilaginibacter conchicola TaxID=2303333 RepID=A0A372NP97_9SPHI|nr:DUF2157 domain-containing protein [Mucilaginibacter conchicola]RFZ90447.1 DUF2157 domain-containing protein [Mucilaginibacter conchicola]